MSRHKTATTEYQPVNDARLGTLQDLLEAGHALTNLGILSIQRRIHDACSKREITAVELNQLQTDFNGVRDHLEALVDTLAKLRHGIPVNRGPNPDGDRDYAGPSDGPDGERFNSMQD